MIVQQELYDFLKNVYSLLFKNKINNTHHEGHEEQEVIKIYFCSGLYEIFLRVLCDLRGKIFSFVY